MIQTGAFPANDPADAVDMSGHEVASDTSVSRQRAFEVDQGTGPGELQIRAFPRLAQQIELNQLAFGSRPHLHDGQAATVHRHAVADFQSLTAHLRTHGQFNRFARLVDLGDDACLFDNAGEHGCKWCRRRVAGGKLINITRASRRSLHRETRLLRSPQPGRSTAGPAQAEATRHRAVQQCPPTA